MAYQDLLVPNNLKLYCGSLSTSGDVYTVSMTFSGPWASPITATVGFQIMGDSVYCTLPSILGTATTSAVIQSSNLPTNFLPSITKYTPSVVSLAGSTSGAGLCTISTKLIFGDNMAGGIFDTGSNVGILPQTILWSK